MKVSPVMERREHSNLSATSPPHFRSQYRLGNVVRCYREAVAGLEGVEGCKHLDVIGKCTASITPF